jgi:anhydro-N-acetylmuramic acid kinase
MKSFRVLGLMSGTSLDGLDIVDISFDLYGENIKFKLHEAHTFPYPKKLKTQLKKAKELSATKLLLLDNELGQFFGHKVNQFLELYQLNKREIDFVSSHGHTIFHQPKKGITLQIGNGPHGAITSRLKWICDFRKKDVALNGNGAPLVPIGDKLLFQDLAEGFLNIGGFSNVSFIRNNTSYAFDICPSNLIFNLFAEQNDTTYDENGRLGRLGDIDQKLLKTLNNLPYYKMKHPKSLGTEWLENSFLSVLPETISLDTITTCYHHVAQQIAKSLKNEAIGSVLITGGGAKNNFLIELINFYYHGEIVLPEEKIIDFKEAIIFALLGVLRADKQPNCLASVTGAQKNSISGIIHYP